MPEPSLDAVERGPVAEASPGPAPSPSPQVAPGPAVPGSPTRGTQPVGGPYPSLAELVARVPAAAIAELRVYKTGRPGARSAWRLVLRLRAFPQHPCHSPKMPVRFVWADDAWQLTEGRETWAAILSGGPCAPPVPGQAQPLRHRPTPLCR